MVTEVKQGSGGPVTRDFMGGCLGSDCKELDLDLHVPIGWEKRLDLQSGKVYIRRCTPTPEPKKKNPTNQTASSSSTFRMRRVNFHQETTPNLELNLFSNALPIHENATYQSVCTLEKVRSALERARKISSPPLTSSSKKRASPSDSDSSMISITNTYNNNNYYNNNGNGNGNDNDNDDSNEDNQMMVAGVCPSCLLYVLISKNSPKCPRCNSVVSVANSSKKLKIDLNI